MLEKRSRESQFFGPRSIPSCLGEKIVILDSYFLALIPPLNFIVFLQVDHIDTIMHCVHGGMAGSAGIPGTATGEITAAAVPARWSLPRQRLSQRPLSPLPPSRAL